MAWLIASIGALALCVLCTDPRDLGPFGRDAAHHGGLEPFPQAAPAELGEHPGVALLDQVGEGRIDEDLGEADQAARGELLDDGGDAIDVADSSARPRTRPAHRP